MRWLVLAAAILALWPLAKPPSYLLLRAIEVFIFGVYAMSYDLLMGFTGIVNFGHTLFFGTGVYAIAIFPMKVRMNLTAAILLTLALAAATAAVYAVLSLRVKGHYFAMVTLAFAEVAHVVSMKWGQVTGGDNGLNIVVPRIFNNRVFSYYLALALLIVAYVVLRRITQSNVGRVFVAIRENEFRAQALGYNVLAYKVLAMVISGVTAGAAGIAFALAGSQFASPNLLAADLTIQALLMVIIGGTGTLYGPVLGAGVVRLLSTYLSGLRSVHPLFARWPLLFGLVYVVIVLFLPAGIAGTLRRRQVAAR